MTTVPDLHAGIIVATEGPAHTWDEIGAHAVQVRPWDSAGEDVPVALPEDLGELHRIGRIGRTWSGDFIDFPLARSNGDDVLVLSSIAFDLRACPPNLAGTEWRTDAATARHGLTHSIVVTRPAPSSEGGLSVDIPDVVPTAWSALLDPPA